MFIITNDYGIACLCSGDLLKNYIHCAITQEFYCGIPNVWAVYNDGYCCIQIDENCHNIANINKFVAYPTIYRAITYANHQAKQIQAKFRLAFRT